MHWKMKRMVRLHFSLSCPPTYKVMLYSFCVYGWAYGTVKYFKVFFQTSTNEVNMSH